MQKFGLYLLIAATVLVSCTGNSGESASDKVEKIELISAGNHTVDQETFAAHMDAYMEAGESFYLLDVRTPEELEETGKIAGALNMDFRSGEFAANIGDLDTEVPVLVYCRSGGRSGDAADIMDKLGFELVLDLEGGVLGWQEAEKQLEEVSKPE